MKGDLKIFNPWKRRRKTKLEKNRKIRKSGKEGKVSYWQNKSDTRDLGKAKAWTFPTISFTIFPPLGLFFCNKEMRNEKTHFQGTSYNQQAENIWYEYEMKMVFVEFHNVADMADISM